ncbi:MAG TPA: quinoprotein dehydrogenase-associated putative ABC transporter substrate-binding protein [Burkholderiaceae bacterium]|nr:quinoprotein dehydrogenase-associated putative ABC transporter substrate-binding protein [Burkholderiaceae bacterium]
MSVVHASLARAGLRGCVFVAALVSASMALAADGPGLPSALRVCIDPSNLPFSNTNGEGIENKIAELFGAKLGLKVEYYAFPQRMNFIRNTLRYRLPGEDYRCDVVLGVPAGYDMVSVTKPYYRSTYALVFPKGKVLDGVRSGPELFNVPADLQKKLRIGVYDKSPASTWLARHGWEDQAQVYPMLSPDPEQYPGEIIQRDLAKGSIDAAVVWGPIAGYYAKRVKSPELVVVPLKSEPGVRFDYEMAMGVRYGEPAWKATIEKLIAENQGALTSILREYNVPLVDERGELVR